MMLYPLDFAEMTKSCPYCGASTMLMDSAVVYGRSYGQLLACSNWPACDAFVGCHSNGQPKGTPANRQLRQARKAAHEAFDPLWKRGTMRRHEAYAYMADILRIPISHAHIALLNEQECARLVAALAARDKRGNKR